MTVQEGQRVPRAEKTFGDCCTRAGAFPPRLEKECFFFFFSGKRNKTRLFRHPLATSSKQRLVFPFIIHDVFSVRTSEITRHQFKRGSTRSHSGGVLVLITAPVAEIHSLCAVATFQPPQCKCRFRFYGNAFLPGWNYRLVRPSRWLDISLTRCQLDRGVTKQRHAWESQNVVGFFWWSLKPQRPHSLRAKICGWGSDVFGFKLGICLPPNLSLRMCDCIVHKMYWTATPVLWNVNAASPIFIWQTVHRKCLELGVWGKTWKSNRLRLPIGAKGDIRRMSLLSSEPQCTGV